MTDVTEHGIIGNGNWHVNYKFIVTTIDLVKSGIQLGLCLTLEMVQNIVSSTSVQILFLILMSGIRHCKNRDHRVDAIPIEPGEVI